MLTTWSSSLNDDMSKFKQDTQTIHKSRFYEGAEFFLGSSFEWSTQPDGHLSVYIHQKAFAEHTAAQCGLSKYNTSTYMRPYWSGLPINSITPPDPDNPNLPEHTKDYQSICISINWLAVSIWPDVAVALSFLVSFQSAPTTGHINAAYHNLKYLASTSSYGLLCHSNVPAITLSFLHFPHLHNVEAYISDASSQPNKKPMN